MAEAVKYMSKGEARMTREKKQTIVDAEFSRLLAEYNGSITTAQVVDAARPDDAPLHRYFEWDDSIAAEHHRQTQAMHLLLASRVVAQLVETEGQPPKAVAHSVEVRQYVSPFRSGGFRMRATALQNPEERSALIAKKIGQLRSWTTSVSDLPELNSIRVAILEWLEKQQATETEAAATAQG